MLMQSVNMSGQNESCFYLHQVRFGFIKQKKCTFVIGNILEPFNFVMKAIFEVQNLVTTCHLSLEFPTK